MSSKGIRTSVSRDSRVWFTLGHGIFNEIYYAGMVYFHMLLDGLSRAGVLTSVAAD